MEKFSFLTPTASEVQHENNYCVCSNLLSEVETHTRIDVNIKEESPFKLSLFKCGKACIELADISSRSSLIQVFWIDEAVFHVLRLGIYSLLLQPTERSNTFKNEGYVWIKLKCAYNLFWRHSHYSFVPILSIYDAPRMIKN